MKWKSPFLSPGGPAPRPCVAEGPATDVGAGERGSFVKVCGHVGRMQGAASGPRGGHARLPNGPSCLFPGRQQGRACPVGGVCTVALSP